MSSKPFDGPDGSNKESIDIPNVLPSDHEKSSSNAEDDFPDGGLRAWLVALGAGCALFCTLGYTNAFGIFQAYYMFELMPEQSADNISWIGAVQAFLIFASGAIGGPLFDRFGSKVIYPAVVGHLFSIMMTSISTKYWHFILSQGFLSGICIGLLMFPVMSAVPQWFNKKRGAAMGATVAGSSLGGVIFPIVLNNLLENTDVSFGWAVRIVGFIMLPFLCVTMLTVRGRLPRRNTRFFLPESFKNRMYVLLIVSTFFTMIGMFVSLFLMPTYAITRGMDSSLANYLVAILNTASFFGRVIPGVLGDKLGRINTLVAAGLSTGILCFCWPLAKTNASIIVISILLGFCSGAIASGASVAFTLCPDDPKNMGTYMGVGMALAAGAAIAGPPTSGALLDKYGGFDQVSWFAGVTTLFGAMIAIAAKSQSKMGLFGRT